MFLLKVSVLPLIEKAPTDLQQLCGVAQAGSTTLVALANERLATFAAKAENMGRMFCGDNPLAKIAQAPSHAVDLVSNRDREGSASCRQLDQQQLLDKLAFILLGGTCQPYV